MRNRTLYTSRSVFAPHSCLSAPPRASLARNGELFLRTDPRAFRRLASEAMGRFPLHLLRRPCVPAPQLSRRVPRFVRTVPLLAVVVRYRPPELPLQLRRSHPGSGRSQPERLRDPPMQTPRRSVSHREILPRRLSLSDPL